MKLTALAMAVAAIGSQMLMAQQTIAVCMADGLTPGWVAVNARAEASKMFKDIGVGVQWRCGGFHDESVTIRVTDATPSGFHPQALAFATPDANRIQVMYDRIQAVAPARGPQAVLAHVLVHEITHVLENACRHSDRGVMKAQWDAADYREMAAHPMPFAPIDVELIQAGFANRTVLLAAK